MTTASAQLHLRALPPRSLLHGSIIANAKRHYRVTLTPTEGQSASERHILRFALHYYARVLYVLSHTERSVRDLPSIIDRVACGAKTRQGDLFALTGEQGQITVAVEHPIGEVDVSLRQYGLRDFEVEGDTGLAGRTLATSVIAVLETILPLLALDTADTLLAALAHMNASYTVTHRYRDAKSCREVPAVAFLAATFV